MPPRACARPAECSSSAATCSSSPAAACARCQARRSRSTSASVAWRAPRGRAGALRRRGAIHRRAHQRMTEAHLRTEMDQSAAAAGRRRLAGYQVRRPPATPKPGPPPARPPPAEAAAASRAAAAPAAPGSSVRFAPATSGRRAARIHPRTRPASGHVAAQAALAGFRAFGHDPVTHPLIERTGHHCRQ